VIRSLPPESGKLITMRFIDGLKPQEIGELLALPANTVSVKIHRALKELKSLLKP
jgi:RNA polymerase sigma factor (sigma-70 family)